MAKIINDLYKLPITIAVSDVKTFEKHSIPESFIKKLVAPVKNSVGVERDTYYIISTQSLLRFKFSQFTQSYFILRELLDACYLRNINLIMIKK